MSEQLYTKDDLAMPITHFSPTEGAKWLEIQNITFADFMLLTEYNACKLEDGRVWDRTLKGFRP